MVSIEVDNKPVTKRRAKKTASTDDDSMVTTTRQKPSRKPKPTLPPPPTINEPVETNNVEPTVESSEDQIDTSVISESCGAIHDNITMFEPPSMDQDSTSDGSDSETEPDFDNPTTVVSNVNGGVKRGRKPKYNHIIVLEGVNARDLYRKFKSARSNASIGEHSMNGATSGIGIGSGGGGGIFEYGNVTSLDSVGIDTSSHVTELSSRKPANVSIDPKTQQRQVTFIDYVKFGSLPNRTDMSCWHCRHPFSTSPIGCPIRFIEPTAEKHHIESPISIHITSNNEDSSFAISNSGASATTSATLNNTKRGNSSLKTIPPIVTTNSHYLTLGVFCSFPCVLAHIDENKHIHAYRDSKSLLQSLYYKLYSTDLNVKPASSWQSLKSYGGTLTIEEFRRAFCTCNYVITKDIRRPFMVSVGKHIEVKQYGYY